MLTVVLTGFIGMMTFLFLFWKRLKEDYSSEIIFKTSSYVILGILLGYIVSARFFREWFLYAELLGVVAGLWFANFRFKIRVYEMLEASVQATLPWISLLFLHDSIVSSSFVSFSGFLLTLAIIFFYYYMDLHYREFTWYKSGKVGFSGLITLGLIFLIRSVIAISGISVLSFVGKYEGILSGILAFICFLVLFNLGRKS